MRQRFGEATWVGGPVTRASVRAARWVWALLLVERERWPLWLPVCFGAGIGGYFALASEPPVWLGTAGVAFALLLAVAGRMRPGAMLPAVMLATLAGGFAAAQLRTQQVAAPVLQEELAAVHVIGRVLEVQPRERGVRLLLDSPEIERLRAGRTPARVRVAVVAGAPGLRPGDRVRVRAVLRPPPEPAAPGAFDFARHAFFERLGAVGFALGGVERLAPAPSDGWPAWQAWWAAQRHAIAARVRERLPGDSGTVAAALMTGERGAIPEPVLEAMRASGLAHLLAISGLHIGLVAGLVFFAVRALLALLPGVALRWPIKKWAAGAAGLAAAGYLLLVGATVPTQRAFLMTALVLLAVTLDRRALTMRLVAWAAAVVLALRPESLLSASFQMSFAAATALVASYESLRAGPIAGAQGRQGWPLRVALYLGGVALTSIVAIAATSPFAAYHFNRVAVFGLAANVVAVPFTAFWVMPWALAAFALMPLGLEGVALTAMGWAIDVVLVVARTVSGWPGATTMVRSAPSGVLVALAAGGLWLCLWQRRWRLLGLLPIAGAGICLALARPPDVLVSGDARLMAVRGAEGPLWLSSERRKRFSADVWRRRAGRADSAGFAEADGRIDLSCDMLGCIHRRGDHVVALVRDGRALAEDCRAATVLISTEPVRRSDCANPLVVIDRFRLWREGGHAIWLPRGPPKVASVRAHRGDRPWVRRRGGAR